MTLWRANLCQRATFRADRLNRCDGRLSIFHNGGRLPSYVSYFLLIDQAVAF